jgi:hypothetical protein
LPQALFQDFAFGEIHEWFHSSVFELRTLLRPASFIASISEPSAVTV